ncbi:uncharacterized protein LOC129279602 [Lytechinus pictus]|uniref:uncharacterized protein LOC129279602 n=1 Tax=Lytechinus pictus TaxID=7653 RepID=UPI0030BA052D
MEMMRNLNCLFFLPILLATFALSPCPAEAFRSHRFPPPRQYRGPNEPPSALESDSDLLHALEFLEQYERAKTREPSGTLPGLNVGFDGADDFDPYPRFGNEIPLPDDIGNGFPYQKWDDDDDRNIAEIDLEDLYEPRPEDLETNEVAFAEAILDEYRKYETERQTELFNKILGDVMAEKILQQDEEDNIARLMEEQAEEIEGLDDLANIFESSNSATGSSGGEAGVYPPQELDLPLFSESSNAEETPDLESQNSDDEVQADDFFVSEAGLEALDEAERILNEGYAEDDSAESSESLPDFDDTSDLTSLLQDNDESEFSEAGPLTEEEKEETLKDVIYRIVQDTLRRKLVESMVGTEDSDEDLSMEESIVEVGDSEEEESMADTEDGEYNSLLDNLVDEIRDQVDKLSSRIMKEIEGEDVGEGDEEGENDNDDESESSDGYFNEEPVIGESSSIPDEIIDEIMGAGPSSFVIDQENDTPQSSVTEFDEDMISDEDLINAIKEIVPAAEAKVCPILSYLVDDCSVIEGFRGLGADGYKQAFSRPCNRHQICYTCSTSYEIPTKLCDEIYKAELLTLCNGDLECMQRAKYFWLAATNDRTAPDATLSLCSDRCVLDYLLSD